MMIVFQLIGDSLMHQSKKCYHQRQRPAYYYDTVIALQAGPLELCHRRCDSRAQGMDKEMAGPVLMGPGPVLFPVLFSVRSSVRHCASQISMC